MSPAKTGILNPKEVICVIRVDQMSFGGKKLGSGMPGSAWIESQGIK